MEIRDAENSVLIRGKVTSAGTLRYSPAGIAVLDFAVSVEQHFLGQKTRGRFDVLAMGDLAGVLQNKLRIGVLVVVEGKLWVREYKHRKGIAMKEVKIVADRVTPQALEKPSATLKESSGTLSAT